MTDTFSYLSHHVDALANLGAETEYQSWYYITVLTLLSVCAMRGLFPAHPDTLYFNSENLTII